jgi:hypothetical protein
LHEIIEARNLMVAPGRRLCGWFQVVQEPRPTK